MRIFSLQSILLCLFVSVGVTTAQITYDPPTLVEFTVDLVGEEGPGKIETFQMEVVPRWSEYGVNRFLELMDIGFFDNMKFYRVLPGLIAQFGVHGDPEVATEWRKKRLETERIEKSNKKGTLSFATNEAGDRTTQMFFNLQDNHDIDFDGYIPFGQVVSGFEVLEKLYTGYGDDVDRIKVQTDGEAYFAEFPYLSKIISVKRVEKAGNDEL